MAPTGWEAAERQINAAARTGPLRADAQHNTTAMLDSTLTSLGYRYVTVIYGSRAVS